MTIAPGLAAGLALLTRTLDLPGTDIADTLTRLVADVRAAVDSYVGLSIAITTSGSPVDLTVLEANSRPQDITTSLLIPLSSTAAGGEASASPSSSIALILFAGVPGAFIDLAADLSWLSGRPLDDFRVDEHCDLPVSDPGRVPLSIMWKVDQAIGVLIGRGSTFEHAERELHERAAKAGIELLEAADLVLADLAPLDLELGAP